MSEPVPMTDLGNGVTVPEPIVRTTIMNLDMLALTNPAALHEVIEMARDAKHVPFGNTGVILAGLGLIEDDHSMRATTRDVILAMEWPGTADTEGEPQ